MHQLITTLDLYFGKKAPQLPKQLKEIIVKIGPYLLIVGLIFLVLGLLALIPIIFGGAVYLSKLPGYVHTSMGMLWISLVLTIAAGVLELMALPGLFKRSHRSWDLMFYAVLIGIVHSLLLMNFFSLIIGGIISFYILFQIRPYYTGEASITPEPPTPAATPNPTV